jgi:hypothetical protein
LAAWQGIADAGRRVGAARSAFRRRWTRHPLARGPHLLLAILVIWRSSGRTLCGRFGKTTRASCSHPVLSLALGRRPRSYLDLPARPGVNVTSPTGLREIDALSGTHLAADILAWVQQHCSKILIYGRSANR